MVGLVELRCADGLGELIPEVLPDERGGAPLQQMLGGLVCMGHAPGVVDGEEADAGRIEDLLRPGLRALELRRSACQLEFVDDRVGEVFEGGELVCGEDAGVGVDGAEGAEGLAERRAQRHTGVEAQVPGGHHRVAAEAGIGRRVFDDERSVVRDDLGAEGRPTRDVGEGGLSLVGPVRGREPEPSLVGDGEDGDGHAEGAGHEPGEPVEALRTWRVEHGVAADDGQPFGVVERVGARPERVVHRNHASA